MMVFTYILVVLMAIIGIIIGVSWFLLALVGLIAISIVIGVWWFLLALWDTIVYWYVCKHKKRC